MKVILLERLEGWGGLGDVVNVKDGFARNFLLPRQKALRATSANLKVFEGQRADLEARNAKAKDAAGKAGEKLDGTSYILIRQAGESGQLYGSVSGRDVADAVNADGGKIDKTNAAAKAVAQMLRQGDSERRLAHSGRSDDGEEPAFGKPGGKVGDSALATDDLGEWRQFPHRRLSRVWRELRVSTIHA